MTDTITDKSSTVSAVYEAFGRGDLPAILDLLDDDVRWDADWLDNYAQRDGAVEHFVPRRGPAQVADFFAILATYTVHDFRVLRVLVGDDVAVAQVVIDATMPGGGRFRDEELHLWTFGADGRIVALRHYIDTAKHLAAARGEDTVARVER
jgi:ketosteroid isomerase-like protein